MFNQFYLFFLHCLIVHGLHFIKFSLFFVQLCLRLVQIVLSNV